MFKSAVTILLAIGGFLALVRVVNAVTILPGDQGGTGFGVSSATTTDIGKVLTVSSTSPHLVYYFSNPASSSSPGGLDTQVQFNSNGVFAGTSTFTFSSSTGLLVAPSISSTNALFINASSTNLFATSLTFTDTVGTNLTVDNLTSTLTASFANDKIHIDSNAATVFALATENALGSYFSTGVLSDFWGVFSDTAYLGSYFDQDGNTAGIPMQIRYGKGNDTGNAILIDGAANTLEVPLSTTLLAGLTFTTASGTSITSTNAFFTNLNLTNLTATSLTSTNANITNLTFTNASGTVISSTRAYISATTSIATTSQLYALNVGGKMQAQFYYMTDNPSVFFSSDSGGIVFNGGYLYAAGAGTGLYVANAAVFRGGISNDIGANLTLNGGTTGNTQINNTLTFNNATGTSITSTNAFFTNLRATTLNLTNLVATNMTSTNGNISSLTFTTASGTSITSTNAYFSSVSTTNMYVGGRLIDGNQSSGSAGYIAVSTGTGWVWYNATAGCNPITQADCTLVDYSTWFVVAGASGCFENAIIIKNDVTYACDSDFYWDRTLKVLNVNGTVSTTFLTVNDDATFNSSIFGNNINGSAVTTNYLDVNVLATFLGQTNFINGVSSTVVTTSQLVVLSSLSLPNDSITDAMVDGTLTITGGSINGTPIGASSPSTGVFTNLTSTNFFATSSILTNLTFTNATGTTLYLSSSFNLNDALTINSAGNLSTSGTLRAYLNSTFGDGPTSSVIYRQLPVNRTTSIDIYLSDPDTLSRGTGVATTYATYSDDLSRILVWSSAAGTGAVSLKIRSVTPANTALDAYYNNAGTLQTITASTMAGASAIYKGVITCGGYHFAFVSSSLSGTSLAYIKKATSSWDTNLAAFSSWVTTTISGTALQTDHVGILGCANNNVYVATSTTIIVPYAFSSSTDTLTAGSPITITGASIKVTGSRVNDNGIYAEFGSAPFVRKFNFSGTQQNTFGTGRGQSAVSATGPSVFVSQYSWYEINGSATALQKQPF